MGSSAAENKRLQAENDALRAQIAALQSGRTIPNGKAEVGAAAAGGGGAGAGAGAGGSAPSESQYANNWSATFEANAGLSAQELIARGRAEPGMRKTGLSDMLIGEREAERERQSTVMGDSGERMPFVDVSAAAAATAAREAQRAEAQATVTKMRERVAAAEAGDAAEPTEAEIEAAEQAVLELEAMRIADASAERRAARQKQEADAAAVGALKESPAAAAAVAAAAGALGGGGAAAAAAAAAAVVAGSAAGLVEDTGDDDDDDNGAGAGGSSASSSGDEPEEPHMGGSGFTPRSSHDTMTPLTSTETVNGKSVEVLPQEVEEGNVEYKLKLVNPSPARFEQLVSQMKWRLAEGMGEAVYEIGVEDNGMPAGLSADELAKSLENLELMAKELAADITVIRRRDGVDGQVAEVLVRRFVPSESFEIRVAIVGNVDAGKSTLLGVLTRGQLDNGRGLARMNVFKHKHELETGRTSSISHEILGFDARGTVVNTAREVHGGMTTSDVAEHSAKLVNFIDLAGHEKYLRTTVFGLSGHAPDFAMLMVGANMGVSGMTKEHLGIALALRVPVFVVVTKIDMCPQNVMAETMDGIKKILKSPGCRKIPIVVRNEDDVVVCARSFVSERIAPIFCVSNVTGECLDQLRTFLNLLPVRTDWEKLRQQPTEFHIDATWSVPGVGTVVSGTVMSGQLETGATYLIGPDSHGKFKPVVAKSVHSKRLPVRGAPAGQTASVNLKKIRRADLRKGMVMLHQPKASEPQPRACREFEAEILVLYHSTTISANYQAVLHCGVAQQTVRLVKLDTDCIRTGDKTTVTFRFMYWPEFVNVGARLIFREGRTKGIGRITRIVPPEEEVAAQDPAGAAAADARAAGTSRPKYGRRG